MDRRQRRLARDEHELPPLLERDRGRAVDEVLHRSRGERPDRRHRARADHVGVHASRAARVRARKSFSPYTVTCAACPRRSRSSTSSRARRGIAVQLGREHLDARARRAQADLAVDGRERAQEPLRVGSARGTRHAEEDAHGEGYVLGREGWNDAASVSTSRPGIRASGFLACELFGPSRQRGTRRGRRGSARPGTSTSPSRCSRTPPGWSGTGRRTRRRSTRRSPRDRAHRGCPLPARGTCGS